MTFKSYGDLLRSKDWGNCKLCSMKFEMPSQFTYDAKKGKICRGKLQCANRRKQRSPNA